MIPKQTKKGLNWSHLIIGKFQFYKRSIPISEAQKRISRAPIYRNPTKLSFPYFFVFSFLSIRLDFQAFSFLLFLSTSFCFFFSLPLFYHFLFTSNHSLLTACQRVMDRYVNCTLTMHPRRLSLYVCDDSRRSVATLSRYQCRRWCLSVEAKKKKDCSNSDRNQHRTHQTIRHPAWRTPHRACHEYVPIAK